VNKEKGMKDYSSNKKGRERREIRERKR